MATIRSMKRSAQRSTRYNTDPASISAHQAAGGVILPFSMFDKTRIMDALRRGLIDGIPELDHPNDQLLTATLVEHGQPLHSAEQLRHHPMLRLNAYLFWMDVQEAAKGNKESQEIVDAAMAAWAQMRKDELISDIPNHTAGFWER